MKKENQERRFLRGRDNSRCPRFRMRNLAAEKFAIGSHQISAANIVATRGLVDTFLSGDLRGFAHTFFRTDKVCPGFGQYVRVSWALCSPVRYKTAESLCWRPELGC